MKGLEFSLRNMSTSANTNAEGEAGTESEGMRENEAISRNQLRKEGKTRAEFDSSHSANSKNNCSKDSLLTSQRSKPKLVCAQAVLSSKIEPEHLQDEPDVTIPNNLEILEDKELKPTSDSLTNCFATDVTDGSKPAAEERTQEEGGKESNIFDTQDSFTENSEVSRKSSWKVAQSERWRGKRRERLGGSVENLAEEDTTVEREKNRGIRWRHPQKQWGSKERRDEDSEKEDVAGVRGMHQGSLEGEDAETRGTVPHRLFSRVLAHSFASSSSSSSSSFNCSSAESDEVFSEGEEMAKKKDTRRCRSWRTFLTMMQWSKRRQSSWVQLAGHQGNVQLGERGEVLKRFNQVEDSCLQALMSDHLRHFVPQYYGHISRDGETYIRLEDLLSGLKQPVIMDCKMGIRTYQEEEIIKARTKASLRTDMYQKMVKVDPTAPTTEEHSRRGITKLRYMQWRDSTSSTTTLGFRVEGIMTEDGNVLRDFNKTRIKTQVIKTLLFFTKSQVHILKTYQSRLESLREALKESTFFKKHEIIGGSLLFVHDRTSKANIWMIDFGKTVPVPENIQLRHDIPWVEGNREDGYLIGLNSLISLLQEAIKEARGESLDVQHSETEYTASNKLIQNQPIIEESTSDFIKETEDANDIK